MTIKELLEQLQLIYVDGRANENVIILNPDNHQVYTRIEVIETENEIYLQLIK